MGLKAHFLFVVNELRKVPSRLEEIVGRAVAAAGYELVGIDFPGGGSRTLRVYIDAATGIVIDDCERASRQISAVLDVEDPVSGRYFLEVSSPGLDRPLFTMQDFERFTGHKISVRLHTPIDGRRKFVGQLRAVEQATIVLDENGAEHTLAFADIDKARLVPQL